MPLEHYDEETFVAFTDISGFKEMMKAGDRAIQAMDHFYQAGYYILEVEPNVNGLFISDCAILFSKSGSIEHRLTSLLRVIKEINRSLLQVGVMLTTSIAWGHFSYHDRIEFRGINKQPIYGNGYLAAFLDNETSTPRIQPGQCRILKKGLSDIHEISELKFMKETTKHLYYYWNVDTPDQIESFDLRYRDTYNLKYSGMLTALRTNG